ncbi:hypothetical protein CEE44_05040 [Candidatus Woesearchaeota archaeon B3_Woes]|nr:MAG: hypothetical protein CEE44_05040 [Candidatus Woesearchaeota archaeon B3_Woes]
MPLEARKELGIDLGDEVYWYEIDGVLVVTKELLSQKDLDKTLRNSVGISGAKKISSKFSREIRGSK